MAFVAETVNNGNGGKKGIYLQTADCGGIIEIVKEGNMLWGKKVAQAALQDSPNRDCPGTTKSVALVILIVFTDGTQTIAKVDIKK